MGSVSGFASVSLVAYLSLEFHLDGVALVISSSSLDFSPSITILQLIKLFIQKIANKNFCRNKNVRINVHKPQNYVCKLISIISYALLRWMCIKMGVATFFTTTQSCSKLFFKLILNETFIK